MDIDVIGLLYTIGRQATAFVSDSYFFAAVKFFLFVYVAVLLVDIVILLMLRGITTDIKKTLFGGERPLLPQSALIKRWEKIVSRLEEGNTSQYKVAILEADAFVDEIMVSIGYRGATMTEKLDSIHEGQLNTKDGLVEAHLIRNRIIHEADFFVSLEDTQKYLHAYRQFFDEVELF